MSDHTLEGAMLGATWGNKVERHMGRTTDVLVRESPAGAFVASTHHTLADKVSSSDHKDEQDDGNDGADSVGSCVWDATGGRRHVLYTRKIKRKECNNFSRR